MELYEFLHLPDSCLVDKTVPKVSFSNNADLLSSDKKLFTNDIDKIVWKYCLKPETINILPYSDDKRTYSEIEVIEVNLKKQGHEKRIAEIITRSMPYPIFLIFRYDTEVLLMTGDMRKSLSDSSKITVDNYISSEWFDLDFTDDSNDELLKNLDFKKLDNSNFYKMYVDLSTQLSKYIFGMNNDFDIEQKVTALSPEELRLYNEQINEYKKQICSLEKTITKNSTVVEVAAVSIKIHALEKMIYELQVKYENKIKDC